MTSEQKFTVDLDPLCDDINLLEPSLSPAMRSIKRVKQACMYMPAQFNFNQEKYFELVRLDKYRMKATEGDCAINILDIGDLISSQHAALLRLVLKRCGEDTTEDYAGISDPIMEEMLSYISETHGESYYYKSLRFSIENLPFMVSILQKLETNKFIIINYTFTDEKGKNLSHVALVAREVVEEATENYGDQTAFYVYDQQVNPLKTLFTLEYFNNKKFFGFVARSTVKDRRYKHGFYGNIIGIGENHYLTRPDLEYEEEKPSEAKLFLGDIKTGTPQITIFYNYIGKLASIHENCSKNSIEYSDANQHMKMLLANANTRMCFLLDKDKNMDGIMGFCFVDKISVNGKMVFYIHDVCVDPDYKGQNVCTALMKYVTKFYQSAEYFLLEVLQTNTGAIRCYQKLYFDLVEETQNQQIDKARSQVTITYGYRMSRQTVKCPDTFFHENIEVEKKYFLTPSGDFYKYGS